MIVFGDDGFRDLAHKGLLNKLFLENFFKSYNLLLKKLNSKKILIGYDTRSSKKYIINIILKNVNFPNKIDIIKNPISTPGLQFLTKKFNCDGIVITASHFKYNYNGFKFFHKGNKLKKSYENFIEKNLNKKKINKIKKIKINSIFPNNYFIFLNKFKLKNNFNKKIIFDLSNGALTGFYKYVKIFKKFKVIGLKNKHNLINEKCGTNNLAKYAFKKKYSNYEYILAFDGDADRFLVFKKKYGIIEVEKIALIFALFFKNKKKISVTGTNITNPWLIKYLRKNNIKFYVSQVGDRNVVDKKNYYNSLFGFETSGHFCFKNGMDGLFSSILFLRILEKKPFIIDKVLNLNINYKKKTYILKKNINLKKLKLIFKKISNKTKSKIILRRSIWTKKYKIYIFTPQKNLKESTELNNLINNDIIKKIIKE